MSAIIALKKLEIIFKSQKKTVRYAQNQLKEGDLMSAKAILDNTNRQLRLQNLSSFPE